MVCAQNEQATCRESACRLEQVAHLNMSPASKPKLEKSLESY